MRRGLARSVCLVCAVITFAASPVLAEDDGTPRGVVPLRAPPAPRQVPVPDVRGMAEGAASRALAEGGLRIGGIERVSLARLEAELGHRYALGTVVQQAPRPSTDDQPSWLARGGLVWLRVAADRDGGTVRPRAPVPVAPRAPVQPRARVQPTEPLGTMPRYTGRVPVPPPPAGYARTEPLPVVPSGPPVTQPPVVQPPVVQPPVVYPPVVQPPVTQPPVMQPPVVQPPIEEGPFVDPGEPDTLYGTADLRRTVTLPCERRQERWHIRPVAGAAFWLGDDNGEVGFYGGVDIGRTFSNCFGVDIFYRYSGGTFDRDVIGGLLEDSGSFQHVGLKGTYNASLDSGGQLFFWAGLGVSYYWADGLRTDDDGVAGFFELGLGYALSDAIRIRIGVNVHAMDTEAGRRMMINDSNGRLLWTVAPSLGLELDI